MTFLRPCFALLLLTIPFHARADSIWKGGNSSWGTASNWNPSGVPTSSTTVQINSGTANITTNAVAQAALIGNGNGSNGTLTIQSGTATITFGHLGWTAGSTGTVTVTGAGSQWNSYSGALNVGYTGTGTLNILSGGKVLLDAVNNPSSHFIGFNSGSNGTVNVSGAGSQWTINYGYLYVGSSGNGTLNIQSGGKVSNTLYSYVATGSSSTGAVTVSGTDSQWVNSSNLYLGYTGNGTLTADAGGKVTAAFVLMANSGDAKATLNLNGTPGSRGVLETSFISEGSGSLGGTVNFNGGLFRATGNNSILLGFEAGDVQLLSGGAFIDTQGFNVAIQTVLQGAGGLTKQGSGKLTLSETNAYSGTTTVEAGKLEVTGSLSGATTVQSGGTLSGTGMLAGVTLQSGAKISPGVGTFGTLNTQGETWNGGGAYVWDVNATSGTAGTNWDFLNLTGALNIAATSGDKFTLDINGSLSGLNLFEFHDWTILTASDGFGGTFDAGKFAFDTTDFASNTGGQFSILAQGNDLVLRYTTVPEPSSAGLFLLGGLSVLARRRRRSRPRRRGPCSRAIPACPQSEGLPCHRSLKNATSPSLDRTYGCGLRVVYAFRRNS